MDSLWNFKRVIISVKVYRLIRTIPGTVPNRAPSLSLGNPQLLFVSHREAPPDVVLAFRCFRTVHIFVPTSIILVSVPPVGILTKWPAAIISLFRLAFLFNKRFRTSSHTRFSSTSRFLQLLAKRSCLPRSRRDHFFNSLVPGATCMSQSFKKFMSSTKIKVAISPSWLILKTKGKAFSKKTQRLWILSLDLRTSSKIHKTG